MQAETKQCDLNAYLKLFVKTLKTLTVISVFGNENNIDISVL